MGNTDSNQVDKYSMTGQRLWRAEGVKPWNVAVDQVDGRIYAAEFIANRVRVVNSNGSLGATFTGGLSNPRGIAVDPVDRSVWVSNQGSGRIVHFSSTGQMLGSFASGAGQAMDLEVNSDTIFLADKTGNVIRMYSKSGTPDRNLRRWRVRLSAGSATRPAWTWSATVSTSSSPAASASKSCASS